jgi:hypothetical protein
VNSDREPPNSQSGTGLASSNHLFPSKVDRGRAIHPSWSQLPLLVHDAIALLPPGRTVQLPHEG